VRAMHTHESTEWFGARARITICSGHAPIAQAFPQSFHGDAGKGLGATNLGLDNFEARFVSNILSGCGMYISCRNSAAELGSNFVLHVTSRQIELR
jgi:hypothetical protein